MAQGSPTDEMYVAEALDIVEGMKNEVPLRVMAGCAVRIHCPGHTQLHQMKMQRNIRDIDFATLRNYKKQLVPLLRERGYTPQLAKFEMDRDIYENHAKKIILDIFYDKLVMCHTIDFVERLDSDFPTLSLADLVLQKLQIIEINERDAKDIIVLFLEHEVGETDNETINAKYIARLLANDWGFYYTVTENVRKNNNLALKYSDLLSQQELKTFQTKTGQLLSMIEKEPKSFKWKMRQKIGTKTIWYNEVEEKDRGTLAQYLNEKQKASQN